MICNVKKNLLYRTLIFVKQKILSFEAVRAHNHCTEVRFANFLSGGFTIMAVIDPPEKKLAKHTSVHCDSMAMVNLNKSKETTPMITTASKVAP